MRETAFAFTVILLSVMLLLTGRAEANFAPVQGVYIRGPGSLIYSGNQSRNIPLWVEASVPVGATPIILLHTA
jgi:hypothetical protein